MSTVTATLVRMPRLSDSMEEGTVTRWIKRDGDTVAKGEELVEIETDKAAMVYEAEASGILQILAREGDTVGLGGPIAELLSEGVEPGGAVPAPERANDRAPASPVARRMAASAGLDLASLAPGSGPRDRVVKRDVESALARRESGRMAETGPPAIAEETPAPRAPAPARRAPQEGAPTPTAKGEVTVEQLTRIQSTVARRMAESRATVPDFSVEVDVDADALVALRTQLKDGYADGPVPSYNDFIVKACAQALREHARANGTFRDGALELHGRVNVGIAVAAEGALVVPVVADADVKSLGTIATETRRLAGQARDGSLSPPDMAGGTFTVSNLGMFGITRFTAVVNIPQAAILAVGGLERRAVIRDDAVVVGSVMTLTLCSDHRVLYGADAAAFLSDVRARLERPMRLLV